MFTLQTPKGELVKVKTPNGNVKMEIRWADGFGPEMTEKFRGTQMFIDSEVLRLCSPYIPKDTGILIQSGTMHTNIGSGEVRYDTPYARRWYYMPARFEQGSGSGMKSIGRGNYWFERMKKEHLDNILSGAKKLAGAK